MAKMRGNYSNKSKPLGDADGEERMTSIWTEPKFGIGQRCILIETPQGNVLWDCITYLDDETIELISGKGGLKAIVISHPHYYTTHLDWAWAFDCPVYIAQDDEEWLSRRDDDGRRKLFTSASEEILKEVTAIKTGGHFPGSLVLLWRKKLMIADSFVTTPVCLPLARSFRCHSVINPGAKLTRRTVRAVSCGSASRNNIIRFHVGSAEHDTLAAR